MKKENNFHFLLNSFEDMIHIKDKNTLKVLILCLSWYFQRTVVGGLNLLR